MANLPGKVALVTGGGRGIGAAISMRLAEDGAAVAITYASSAQKAEEHVKALTAKGVKAIAIKADAIDPIAAAGAVTQTVKQLGALDILVHNAGILATGTISEFSDEDFERMNAVNVRATFYTVREAARKMRDNGRIILIGSVNSDSMPFPGAAVYAMCKGAIASFTRGVARDLGPRGITVNNIQPGPINTEMNPDHGPSAESLKGYMALKRFGKPEEIGGLVSYLAGPEGAFITGAGIKIDGGFDA